MLELAKTLLRDRLGLPPALVLALAGLAAHVLLNALLRRPLGSAVGLLAPLLIGVAIESWEIWIRYRGAGLFAEGNDPLLQILGRHSLDIIAMMAIPAAWVIAARMRGA